MTRRARTGARAAVLALAALAFGSALAQERAIPESARDAWAGCWHPWPGERWEVEARGRALVVRMSFTDEVRTTFGVRGALRARRSHVYWNAGRSEALLGCGPTTQHGQSCALTIDAQGPLVRLIRLGHRRRVSRVEEHRPTRCAR